jgi:hypothetical protein
LSPIIGQGHGDGASAGCLIVVAAFTPAVAAGLDDLAVMRQLVEQRGRHLSISEQARSFVEGEIGGDDDGGALAAGEIVDERLERP